MIATVECAGCQRSFTRRGVRVPDDVDERGFYIVVDTCSRCDRRGRQR